MRHPFYMDRWSPEDRETVRRYRRRIFAFYCAVILILAVAAKLTIDDRQTSHITAVPSALAANQ